MGNKKHLNCKDIQLINQKIELKKSFPSATCEIHKSTLSWHGKIQPTPLSREYYVQIIYKLRMPPQVWVYGDELQKLDDPEFPHHYKIDVKKKRVKICLYRYREFSSKEFLSKTIVPWTVEWLYFYEIWLATGEWCGGGDHPNIGGNKEISEAEASG